MEITEQECRYCKVVRTTVFAHTSDDTISYEGKSSNVSSGCMWGGCEGLHGRDSIDAIRNIVKAHNEWLRTYADADTGETYKIPMKFINDVTLNGKNIAVSQESQGLDRWF